MFCAYLCLLTIDALLIVILYLYMYLYVLLLTVDDDMLSAVHEIEEELKSDGIRVFVYGKYLCLCVYVCLCVC